MFFIFSFLLIFCVLLGLIFFLFSKSSSWDIFSTSVFECGFSSWFFSRYSFSIHYFMVGLVFLFLDLELCVMMPFMISFFSSMDLLYNFFLFVIILVLGLLMEWEQKNLEWLH